MSEQTPLYPVSRRHLDDLTDKVGIMQHAVGARPDPRHGYCSDDVARSLQVDLLHQRELGWAAVSESAWRSVRFLRDAFDPASGRFRNFRHVDGTWVAGPGSEDSHGRAMLALGETMALAPDLLLGGVAADAFERALPGATALTAMRAQAASLLGCEAAMTAAPGGRTARAHRALAGRLAQTFGPRPGSEWPWPEASVTYESALPVRALIVAGRSLGSQAMTETGFDVLDWLIVAQTAPSGHLAPIGNTWWPSDGEKSRFDQQPIEATALLLAAEAAFMATGDAKYRAAIERSYAWFLGDNDLGLMVARPESGGCGDGLTPVGVNQNEGAESTLMWLTALEHVRALRDAALPRAARNGRLLAVPAG